jgi:hypothetical protein
MSGDDRASIEINDVLTQLGMNKERYLAFINHEKSKSKVSAQTTPKIFQPSQKQ